MKNKLSIILLSFIISSVCFSQNDKPIDISGIIRDTITNKGIEYVTIQFCNPNDGKLLYGSITDSTGRFFVSKIIPDNYLLIVSSIGYKTKKLNMEVPKSPRLYHFGVFLAPSEYLLNEIEISAEQLGSRTLVDKTIFIPDSLSLKNSLTGLDLLGKAPGVTVRKSDETIRVLGSSNVLILIDGNNSNRNINAIDPKDIERIEIIDNPSAKYDSDIANVINIILKEDRKKGLKIALSNRYFYSVNNDRSFNSLQIEYEFSRIRVFGSYRFSHFVSGNYIDSLSRISSFDNNIYEIESYSKNNKNYGKGNLFQYGIDYYINKQNLINFTGRFELSNRNSMRNNYAIYSQNDIISNSSNSDLHIDNKYLMQNYTLFYQKKFNKEEQLLTFNTNLYLMDRNLQTKYNTNFFDANNNMLFKTARSEQSKNMSNAINSKLDYSHPISKNLSAEAGMQMYYRDINNSYDNYSELLLFDYTDLRTAYYGVLTNNYKNISFQTGIRAEQFTINIFDSISFSQWNYLPSFSILFNKSTINKFRLIINQKLEYPRFHMLTPFTYYSNDSLSISTGNPYLKPEKYLNFEINYSYKKKHNYISTSLFVKKHQNIIDIDVSVDENNVKKSVYENISFSNKFGGFLYLQGVFLNGFVQASLYNTLFYNHFRDNSFNGITYQSFMSLEFQLPLDMYLTIDASYSGKEYRHNGYMTESPIIDEVSISKSILRDRGVITLGLTDFLIPYSTNDLIQGVDYIEKYSFYQNNTRIIFGFNYYFTKGKRIKKSELELNMERDDK